MNIGVGGVGVDTHSFVSAARSATCIRSIMCRQFRRARGVGGAEAIIRCLLVLS